MKKISFILLLAIIAGTLPAKADEGMWLLPLLEKLNIKQMKEMGCKLSAKDIYDINNSSLKDAVVALNGGSCTAELVSDKGLLLTNHHCGYGAIQALSSVEHDYLNNGFWAMNNSEELPAPGYRITIIESFTDVTNVINAAGAGLTDEKEISRAKMNASNKLIKQVKEGNKFLDAQVKNFYYGNQYFLIVTKTYTDVRLVGTPPSSIGKFGADTDNWMWPRHTGDFSVFRVYADKDNNPANYSPDNVPYTPKKSLSVSLAGVKPNDFTMIMGFPGRTTRYMTASEAEETRNVTNPISIYVRGIRQEIMMKDMLADPKIKIQYASKYAGSSNGWKKWIGMDETFDKLKVIDRRKADEAKFMSWVNADPERVKKYGTALSTIEEAINKTTNNNYVFRYFNESLLNIELLQYANFASRPNGVLFESAYKNYSMPTDKKIAKAMIKIFKEKVDPKYYPAFYKTIDEKFGGDIDKYVDDLYAQSAFSDFAKYKSAVDNKVDMKNDPAALLLNDILSSTDLLSNNIRLAETKFPEAKKAYTAGIMEMRGNSPMYPDANSTLRLTYGKVMPYSPKDAVEYDYITTLDGVMEKEDPSNWEFVVPAKLKELYKNKDFNNSKYGSYALSNGKMPVAFISNNDITGGNSGSPIMNNKGELLGLAFDGNWEAMSGDVIFEPLLQRCINVDIRYVLFIMDKFGGAGYLLDEMKIVR